MGASVVSVVRKEIVMKVLSLAKRFVREEQGMETVEWGVLAALIVAGVVTVIAGLGTNISNKFVKLSNATT